MQVSQTPKHSRAQCQHKSISKLDNFLKNSRSYEDKVNAINEEMLDPMIRDKLNLLNKKKQQLVEVEDFDKAKDLKLIIDKIKVIGAQIAKMEFQK